LCEIEHIGRARQPTAFVNGADGTEVAQIKVHSENSS